MTDITYIKTHEGWVYLSVVIDLFSRRVVDPLSVILEKSPADQRVSTITDDNRSGVAVSASSRLAAQPKLKVMIHSDQGSQFTNRDWQSFLRQHNLEASMSRRGNCHDNAVAESFFQLLKRKRIRRRAYPTRGAARQDVFSYIEMFYNPNASTRTTGCCHPLTLKTGSRIGEKQVSTKLEAPQLSS